MRHHNVKCIVAAAALLALCGCSRSSIEDGGNAGREIGYTIAVSPVVKGELVNTSRKDQALSEFLEVTDSFTVDAFDDDGVQTITATTVKWNDSSKRFESNPVSYWPQATRLAFLASANMPYGTQAADTATASATKDGITLTYKAVPADAAEQRDILLGTYVGAGSNMGLAEIRFEHPLTAVIFRVGTVSQKITSVQLTGLAAAGQVTLDASHKLGGWTAIGGGDISSYDLTASVSNSATLAGGDTVGTPFVVIPQNLADHNVGVTVTLADGTSGTITLDEGKWQAGKTNVYNINFGGNDLNLALDITPWNEDAETEELSMREELLPGHFSIGQNKYVRFSCGNLFCTDNGESSLPRYTFGFEMNQYDCRTRYGYTNQKAFYNGVESSTPEHTSGSFQWGVSSGDFGAFSNGIEFSSAESMDWGPAIGSGWTTVSKSELDYLLNYRTCDNRFAKAIIGSIKGLLLFPDNWTPSSHTINSINVAAADYSTNELSISEFSQLEREGVVFLPSSGGTSPVVRDDGNFNVEHFNKNGNYYTSTKNNTSHQAIFIGYDKDVLDFLNNENYGRSVRLVQRFYNTPADALQGLFSVSGDKQVLFSKGNLRYNTDTQEWSFFDKQYECGPGNYSDGHNKEISLFSWGYNKTNSIAPDGHSSINVSRTSGDLTQAEDWGYVFGGESSSWRTLTKAEWVYLFKTRTMDCVTFRYTENITYCERMGVVLYPDDYNGAELSGAVTELPEGVVFLPAAGQRDNTNVTDVGTAGTYWSSTASGSGYAYTVSFNADAVNGGESQSTRNKGNSVRLVRNI